MKKHSIIVCVEFFVGQQKSTLSKKKRDGSHTHTHEHMHVCMHTHTYIQTLARWVISKMSVFSPPTTIFCKCTAKEQVQCLFLPIRRSEGTILS